MLSLRERGKLDDVALEEVLLAARIVGDAAVVGHDAVDQDLGAGVVRALAAAGAAGHVERDLVEAVGRDGDRLLDRSVSALDADALAAVGNRRVLQGRRVVDGAAERGEVGVSGGLRPAGRNGGRERPGGLRRILERTVRNVVGPHVVEGRGRRVRGAVGRRREQGRLGARDGDLLVAGERGERNAHVLRVGVVAGRRGRGGRRDPRGGVLERGAEPLLREVVLDRFALRVRQHAVEDEDFVEAAAALRDGPLVAVVEEGVEDGRVPVGEGAGADLGEDLGAVEAVGRGRRVDADAVQARLAVLQDGVGVGDGAARSARLLLVIGAGRAAVARDRGDLAEDRAEVVLGAEAYDREERARHHGPQRSAPVLEEHPVVVAGGAPVITEVDVRRPRLVRDERRRDEAALEVRVGHGRRGRGHRVGERRVVGVGLALRERFAHVAPVDDAVLAIEGAFERVDAGVEPQDQPGLQRGRESLGGGRRRQGDGEQDGEDGDVEGDSLHFGAILVAVLRGSTPRRRRPFYHTGPRHA